MSEQETTLETAKAVRLYLDEADHAELRVMAAEAGKPMSQFVRELVQQHIQNRRKKVKKTV